MKYYVSQWSLLRKDEIIELPEDFEIHSDYLKILDKDEVISAVRNIRAMFLNIYQDIADFPERFKMPMIEINENEFTPMGAPPAKALPSKTAPFMFFDALINVLISGHMENDEIIIEDAENLKEANNNYKVIEQKTYQIKNVDRIYSQFENYGFHMMGLKNYKFIKDNPTITLSYLDEPALLMVLKWMADKAHKFGRRHDFMQCHYRLLQDSVDSCCFGKGLDYVVDRLHAKEERDCAYKIDAALRKLGLVSYIDTSEDSVALNYSLLYYENKKDIGKFNKSNFRISSSLFPNKLEGMKLPCVSSTQKKLYFRIRTKNIQNSAEHIEKCSDNLRGVFVPGDTGCGNRPGCEGGRLGGGQSYVIDYVSCWKCGCATGKFVALQPCIEDVNDYIKLAELCNR